MQVVMRVKLSCTAAYVIIDAMAHRPASSKHVHPVR